MQKRVMILGAGSTGRAHIGELAYEAGWELLLVDKDPRLVAELQHAGRYQVRLYGPQGVRQVCVDRFQAFQVDDTERLVREALEIPLILTSLFSQNLPEIAPLIAKILTARQQAAVSTELNIICCENMQNSSSILRGLVEPLLSPEVAEYARAHVGFPDCMISRVVPLAVEHPLDMPAEDYNEWTVDAAGFVGPPVDLPAMELVTDQDARLARKFFLHNGGHAVCAYWGFHRGHTYIHEAVADPFVLDRVVGAIHEIARVVARRYGFSEESALEYGLELGARGAVAELKDLILRVVRDPLRKLSRPERFVAPAEMALAEGLPCAEIVRGIAAVLHYTHPDDPQSLEMQRRLQEMGAEGAIPSILGLPDDHQLVALVIAAYRDWSSD
ncbi:MAG: mannitol dehydrogenase family protein [Armatimonadota bacterium]